MDTSKSKASGDLCVAPDISVYSNDHPASDQNLFRASDLDCFLELKHIPLHDGVSYGLLIDWELARFRQDLRGYEDAVRVKLAASQASYPFPGYTTFHGGTAVRRPASSAHGGRRHRVICAPSLMDRCPIHRQHYVAAKPDQFPRPIREVRYQDNPHPEHPFSDTSSLSHDGAFPTLSSR